jgi:aspartate/methionine/tyrosine aminotransferase
MKVEHFEVENWMNEREMTARWNLGETCVDSLTLEELLALSDDPEEALARLRAMKLTYGFIAGAPRLRELLAATYADLTADRVLTMNGAIGANFVAEYTLVEPGDRVVCVQPTYQQLHSVPEGFGAEVRLLRLRPENGFLPDVTELRELAGGTAALIVINNPNNPTGALMRRDLLEQVVEIARENDAYLLADEVYRGLLHDPQDETVSVVDLYEKGVSTGSMSKVYSLAGLRLGWIAGPRDVVAECEQHRHHTTISCGMLDEQLAIVALEARGKLLERNLSLLRANAAVLDEWVCTEPHLDYVRPQAGTTAFVHYEYPAPSRRFADELQALNGAFLVPGGAFGWENWLRIGFACSRETLENGLAGVSEYMRTLER